jgi:hypothetical protein
MLWAHRNPGRVPPAEAERGRGVGGKGSRQTKNSALDEDLGRYPFQSIPHRYGFPLRASRRRDAAPVHDLGNN